MNTLKNEIEEKRQTEFKFSSSHHVNYGEKKDVAIMSNPLKGERYENSL